MATFSKKQVRDAATVAVRQLGYEEMKRKQLEVVSGVLNGQDVFAVLPTGFGKSLCFASLPSIYDQLLPLAQPSIVIVVTPLTATDRCRIRSRVYYAGVSVNVNYIILRNQHESAHSNVTSRVC